MSAPVTGLDPDFARLGVTGALRTGPLGVTLPTDLGTWGSTIVNLGYISDDGITEAASTDRTEFIPWQGVAPIRTEVTKNTKTFAATLWESNWEVVSLYYGVGVDDVVVTGTGDAAVVVFDEYGKPKRDLRMFGIDVIDGVYARRIIVPYGEVTEKGDITYKSDTLIAYPVTITAYVGPDGVSVRRMFREGWAPPAVEGP
jgi:hypothetical protein